MLDGAGHPFDATEVERAKLTPVFFGSAANNFGVQLLLDAFLELAPPPRARPAEGRTVEPLDDAFSGFVFKVQTNMGIFIVGGIYVALVARFQSHEHFETARKSITPHYTAIRGLWITQKKLRISEVYPPNRGH